MRVLIVNLGDGPDDATELVIMPAIGDPIRLGVLGQQELSWPAGGQGPMLESAAEFDALDKMRADFEHREDLGGMDALDAIRRAASAPVAAELTEFDKRRTAMELAVGALQGQNVTGPGGVPYPRDLAILSTANLFAGWLTQRTPDDMPRLLDELQNLRNRVAQQDNVAAGAAALLDGIPGLLAQAKAQVVAGGVDPVQLTAIDELSNDIRNTAEALALALAGGSVVHVPEVDGAEDKPSDTEHPQPETEAAPAEAAAEPAPEVEQQPAAAE